MQKRERKIDIEPDWVHLGVTENGIAVNSYFAEHPEMMLGVMEYDTRIYGQDSRYTVCVNGDENFNMYEALNKAISNIKAPVSYTHLDTVQTVTSAYVQEFNRDVNTKVNEHTGYDLGELVYVDYEGMEENPSNYYDIMAVYMVKHGVGDTATVMNDTSKGWLQAVVNDMCSYTTSTGTKDVEETDADGNVTTVTKSVLYVNVTLKSYRDMISV